MSLLLGLAMSLLLGLERSELGLLRSLELVGPVELPEPPPQAARRPAMASVRTSMCFRI
jgi:hypothetical protein